MPDGSTPLKLITVIWPATPCESVPGDVRAGQDRGCEGAPDFGIASLGVRAADQRPRQPAARHGRDRGRRSRGDVVEREEREQQLVRGGRVEGAGRRATCSGSSGPRVLVTSMVMNVGATATVNATPLTLVVLATVTDWLSGVKTMPLFARRHGIGAVRDAAEGEVAVRVGGRRGAAGQRQRRAARQSRPATIEPLMVTGCAVDRRGRRIAAADGDHLAGRREGDAALRDRHRVVAVEHVGEEIVARQVGRRGQRVCRRRPSSPSRRCRLRRRRRSRQPPNRSAGPGRSPRRRPRPPRTPRSSRP